MPDPQKNPQEILDSSDTIGDFEVLDPQPQEILDSADKIGDLQVTFLDLFNYAVSFETLANMEALAYNGTRYRFYDEDDNPITAENNPELFEKQRYELRESKFSADEERRLTIETKSDTHEAINDANYNVRNKLRAGVRAFHSLEEQKSIYQQMGMMMALRDMKKGQMYQDMLDSLPEDEPYREEKAGFLTTNVQNEDMIYDKAIYEVQKDVIGAMSESLTANRQNSLFGDIDNIKKMTAADYIEMTMKLPEEVDSFYGNLKKNGFDAKPESSMYDILRSQILYSENYKKKMIEQDGGHYEIKEPSDEEILKYGYTRYCNEMREAYMRQGMEMALSNMSPEERRLAETGHRFRELQLYETPKPIKKWSEKEGIDLSIKPRVDALNANYDKQYAAVFQKEVLGFAKKNSILKKCYPETTEDSNAFDKYRNEHIHGDIIGLPLEEQKIHLAKVIAANALESRGKPFNVKTINSMAKRIGKMHAFKDMKEQEVARGLYNVDSALNAQLNLAKKSYGVDPSQYRSYINNMKKLSASMVPKGRQSEEYKKLKGSIDAIANLKATDEDIEFKMMSANETLINAIEGYSKGKKKVRTYEEGRARYDNCMDALAVAVDHVPGIKPYADAIVNRTNTVRKVNEGDKNYVDLKNFGASHAEQSLKKRQGNKENRFEKVNNDVLGINR